MSDSSLPDLSGRVVVVTGAHGRLGRVVARHLAEAGARVAGLDRAPHDVGDLSVVADVTDEAAVAEVLGTFPVVVAVIFTWPMSIWNSSATTCAILT